MGPKAEDRPRKRKRKRLTYEQKQRRAELESLLFGEAQHDDDGGTELDADLQAAASGAPMQQSDKGYAPGAAPLMWEDRLGAQEIDFHDEDEEETSQDAHGESRRAANQEASSPMSKQSQSSASDGTWEADEADEDASPESRAGGGLAAQDDVAGAADGNEAGKAAALQAAVGQIQGARPRRPVWEDPADAATEVNIAGRSRLRKLRRAESEAVVTGKDYEQRLRQQHAKLNPRTSWAQPRPPRRLAGSDDDEGKADALLERAGPLVVPRSELLPAGRLEATRLRDANGAEPSASVVRSVEFHPGGQLLLTAGLDKRLRFFQVDGVRNPKVQSIFFEDMPIHQATFANGGSQVVVAGRRKHFYVVDLGSARLERVPGLLGRPERSFEAFAASPAPEMPLVAFLGDHGCVPLFSLRSRQAVGELKMSGSARAAAFAADGARLFTSGSDGVVHTWDLRTRRCLERLADEGATGAASLGAAPNGRLLATGSPAGVVNVYAQQAQDKALTSTAAGGLGRPAPAAPVRPLKALMNLVTTVDTLAFSPDSQVLAIASRMKRDALRLVHVPSLTAFSNWPTSRSPLHYVHSLAFSPAGGMLAVGNARGRVLLYRLHHYAQA